MEQMRQFIRYAGGVLVFYSEQKRKIQTSSLWFKSRRQHKKWILTDSMEITLALNSGTGLSPTEIRDYSWLERNVVQLMDKLGIFFLKNKDISSLIVGIEVYVQIFEMGLVQNLSIEESILCMTQMQNSMTNAYKIDVPQVDLVTMVDSDGRVAIGNLLGFVRYIDTFTVEKVDKIFSRSKISKGDIYDGTIPFSILNNAERLASDLKNEKIIEGVIYTPDWYVKTTLTFYLLGSIKKYFEHIKSLHESFYEKRIDALLTDEKLLVASQLLQRWLEFASKYQMCVSATAKVFNALVIYNNQLDLDWPVFTTTEEQSIAEKFQNRAIDKMTKLLPSLASNPIKDEDLPDYFGQAFTFGVEACYLALEANDVGRFKNIFPSVFVGSIVAFNTTKEDTKGWLEQSQIVFSSEPLTDLIEISGYAKLYAELYQNEDLWEACKSVWDRYLDQEDSRQIVQIIVSATSYRKNLFMLMPKGLLRTNWGTAFNRKLSELGLINSEDMLYGGSRNKTINHPSKLIRVVVSRSIMPVHPENIFFITYLKGHPIARDLEFPDDRDSIEDILTEDDESSKENENI